MAGRRDWNRFQRIADNSSVTTFLQELSMPNASTILNVRGKVIVVPTSVTAVNEIRHAFMGLLVAQTGLAFADMPDFVTGLEGSWLWKDIFFWGKVHNNAAAVTAYSANQIIELNTRSKRKARQGRMALYFVFEADDAVRVHFNMDVLILNP